MHRSSGQVDYHIGQIGEYENGWKRQSEMTVYSAYASPIYEPGAANLKMTQKLPDVVSVALECVR